MEKKKKKKSSHWFILIILFVLLFIVIRIASKDLNADLVFENDEKTEISEISSEDEADYLEEEKVVGYHLVTYKQTANINSFINSIEVTATTPGTIRFVIGAINSNNVVVERKEFELDCQEGTNTFDLLSQRYFIKEGDYLFMDISSQGVLYTKGNNQKISLVQTEANKVSGKMTCTESDYALPFKYSLAKITKYNMLVIGNDITTKDDSYGLSASDEEHDYYYLLKKRLEEKYEKLDAKRISGSDWEEDKIALGREEWLKRNITESNLKNVDLIVIQLGDLYNSTINDFENDATELINRIRIYAPNAKIVWVGLWFENNELLNKLPEVCEKLDMDFVNISDLDVKEYQALIQTDSRGKEENDLESVGELFYPNDEGMQVISDRISNCLGI